MGRFTAYDQNGRMVADFDKSEYDFLCRYGRMPEEVLDENAKLREEIEAAKHDLQVFSMRSVQLDAENAKLREEVEQWHRLTAGIELPEYPITEFKPKDLERENAKLREYAKLMHTHIKVCCDACGECGFCDIDALTRELGIEANDGN